MTIDGEWCCQMVCLWLTFASACCCCCGNILTHLSTNSISCGGKEGRREVVINGSADFKAGTSPLISLDCRLTAACLFDF